MQKGYNLQQVEDKMRKVKKIPYELRQFEDSYYTKFFYEQAILITLSLNFLAIASMLLSFMQALAIFEED
jgi:hypothetical protein